MIPPPPGRQATAERHAALDPLHRVFPWDQCDFGHADAHNYGRRTRALAEAS